MNALHALQRYTRSTPAPTAPRCELCASTLPVGTPHAHVADLARRALCCSCQACAILFKQPGAGDGRYRTVQRRVTARAEPTLSDDDWSALGVPVRLVFFLAASGREGGHALYPSPAGTVEAEVDDAAWSRLIAPGGDVQRDVEGILMRAPHGRRGEAFVVSVDVFYELAARVRRHWEGFNGGDAVQAAVDDFFERLRREAR